MFDDFVGAVGEVEGLGFAVVAHVEHAGAVDEGFVAVSAGFSAGHSIYGDFDEGEGVEFDQGVIFPVGAGVAVNGPVAKIKIFSGESGSAIGSISLYR